jgi:hypothetical protein
MDWRSVSASVAVAAAVSCVARSDEEPVFVQEPGTTIGELVVRIADFEDGKTETMYALRTAEGEHRLVFPNRPDVEPGTLLKVWGRGDADGIVVDKFQAAPAGAETIGEISSPLSHPTPQAPWIFCSAVVAINNAQVPASLSVPTVEETFHTGPKSANAYIVENSFGQTSYAGKTYGPFNYNMTSCDFEGLGDAIRPMIPDKCDHYGFVLAPNQKSCAWAGIAESGTATKPQKDTWYNAIDIGTIVQENAHNRGVSHASSITCTGAPFADNLSGCRHDEYGDHFDVMGLGQRHMHAYPKLYLGWFGGCNVVKVTSSGTFNLLPIEAACDGVQALQIPFPGGKTRPFSAGGVTLASYYLEYRAPLGVDTGMTPQVFIHTAPNPVAASKTAPNSWLLNASGNSKNPGLVAGGTFSDPAGGLTITVSAIDSQKATVQVDYPGGTGAPACLDGTSLTPPGPIDCIGTATPDGGTGPIPDSGSAGAGGGGRDAGGTGGSRDAGSAGAGGRGGASGGPDAGASGGSAGATGGAAGSATAGSGGSAGSVPTGGVGGSSVGAGGSSVAAGGSRRPGADSDLDGGCSCRIGAPSTPPRPPLVALALGFALSLMTRRRSRTHGREVDLGRRRS